MAAQTPNLGLRSYVPHSRSGVPPTSYQQVQIWMQSTAKDSGQVTVILADDLILFKIPALNLFILADRKQIRTSGRDANVSHSVDVPRKRQFANTRH